MSAPSDDPFGLNSINEFLKDHLGLTPISIRYLFQESDWVAIIKMHAYVEASLNFLIVRFLGHPELYDVIARLDVSDRVRGKMAFIKALDLLPSEQRSFIQKLSEIRNSLVHDAKNLDFKLLQYIADLDSSRRKELKGAVIPAMRGFAKKFTYEQASSFFDATPEVAILVCVMAIMSHVYGRELLSERLKSETERGQSTPKEP